MEVFGETLFLVIIVIFLFLGTLRATLIPVVTIPISIVAAAIVMALAGYSINVLTLLGMVLAIGLVVDDAIVVMENIVRRIEGGEPPLLAAVNGSREIAFAVIATTLVLIAVFVPLSYLQGNIGRLFSEFGITLAAAVAFSALVALTLTPMMCSKLFARGIERRRLAAGTDRFFRRLSARYERALRAALRAPALVAGGAAAVLGIAVLLYSQLPKEYAPTEDRAMLRVSVTAPEGSSVEYRDRQVLQVEDILLREMDAGTVRRVLVRSGSFGRGSGDVSSALLFVPLSLWHERKESAAGITARLRGELAAIPGVRANVVMPGSLGIRGSGEPVQIVLGGGEYSTLVAWRDRVLERAAENPRLMGVQSDYYERKPQIEVSVDRNRAADLGVSLQNVGRTLETMLGSRIVTTYLDRGEEYNVILQAGAQERATVDDLNNIHVRSDTTGALIPLSSLVQFQERAGPIDLKRFDRLRAITLSAGLAPGYSLGEALDWLDEVVREEAPPGGQVNYDGESREFKLAGGALYFTFLLALAIVFLVLAAQFESFIHPLVIMATVPLAVTGALIGLWVFGQSINVFSQIGAIMLIGIAAKNGILIVEFTNQLRDRGREFMDAIVEASVIRLRPVLMTSLCTSFGAIPLLIAWGAGAESRRPIGAAVFFGVLFAMVLTLFVVPALYALIARNTRSPEHVARAIERLREKVA
jgi:multidrug efflux pump